VLSFLIAVHKNKQLAESIKHILQVFPECVVIREWKTLENDTETVFVNNEAVRELYEGDTLEVKIVHENEECDENHISLDDLLFNQENKVNKESVFDRNNSEKILITHD
jgi:hypothetical protein